jgi:hypothetical protein
MRLAGDLSRRENTVESWLLLDATIANDADGILRHADVLLRRRQAVDATLSLLVAALRLTPAMGVGLADSLSRQPPWREEFFNRLGPAEGMESAERVLLLSLSRGPAPPVPTETAPFVRQLVDAQRFEEAYAAWSLSAPASLRGQPVRNVTVVSSALMPFGWELVEVLGANQTLASEPTPTGAHALRVQYSGADVTALARQLLVLTPGAWSITWMERAEQGDSNTLRWRVRCAPDGDVLGHSTAGTAGAGWEERRIDLQVPATCRAQWLELSPSALGGRTVVSVLYAGFAAHLTPGSALPFAPAQPDR